ncbi:MAG: hypothetical protein J1G06_03905 [Oscillospiraceae bacterium]|nr:hypothetical protein [Oscillospiraceae bacterium]
MKENDKVNIPNQNIPPGINTGNKNCISVPNVQPDAQPDFQTNVQSDFQTNAQPNFQPNFQQADHNGKGGSIKWVVIILSAVAILGVIFWVIMSNAHRPNTENKKTQPYTYDKTDSVDTSTNNYNSNTEKVFSKGILTSESYKSEFVGLRYSPPENWVMRTREEMEEQFVGAEDQCEMGTINAITNESINVLVEKLPSKNMTIEQCVKAVENTFSGSGMILVSDDETVDFNGEEYRDLIFDMEFSGVVVKTEMYIRKENDRLIYLMMQYRDGNRANLEPALNAFSQY